MEKIYRSETVAMLNRFLFGVTIVVILVMTLLGSYSLNELYLLAAQVLPVDSAWVKKHATEISNIGHLVSCFILTCFGCSVFRINFLKGIFYVAGLAVFGEFLQSFSSTRQANLKDIVLSFAGILLASTMIFFIKGRRFKQSWQ